MLLGSSFSTLIAKDFAARYPDRVSALILVGPTFSPYGSARRELLGKSWIGVLEAGGPSELFSHIYPQLIGDKAIQEGGAAGYLALKERFLAMTSARQLRDNLGTSLIVEDNPAALYGLQCPVLLLAGDGDFLASRSSMEEIAKHLPNATIELVPYAGHVPFFDASEAFQDSVEKFILDVDRNSAE
jgi:pimeloyl-ACP methyl ester carboxylesterase